MTVPFLTAENLAGHSRLRHAFFTRAGGTSDGVYESLNIGYGSNDARAKVTENRRRAMAALERPAETLATLHQVHGDRVVEVDRPWPVGKSPKADAMVTTRPGIVLGVMTADCVPVLFADAEVPVIGAAHAGWRGAAGGVLAATVAALESLGARRATLNAAVGPAIAQASYEVGPEFPDAFRPLNTESDRFFVPSVRTGRHMFDLPGFVRDALQSLGLAAVDLLDRDTCAEEDLFFSYRRAPLAGESDYGRGLSAITLDP